MIVSSSIPHFADKFFQFRYLIYPFKPFQHQRTVFESIYHSNILLESPTSSGKTASAIYPIIDQVKDTNCRALFVYPTRALLWDQYQTISKVANEASLNVAKLDPFTPTKDLYGIFAQNRIITMTPDIFYFTILRNAQHYKRFYERSIESVAHIVFDEIHLYDTYMLFNLKHLLRIIREINPDIKTHCLSATVEHVIRNLEKIIDFKIIRGESFTGEIVIESFLMPNFQLSKEIEELLGTKGKKVIILNSAKRAQEIYEAIKEKYSNIFVVLGQRFQAEDTRNNNLSTFSLREDAILVASPIVEQGVDFKADIIITEDPASLASIIQRFGRVGRSGSNGKFVILVKTASRNDFYNRQTKLTRSEFEQLLGSANGAGYFNEPLQEELEMMQAMLWKVWKQTEFKDTFEKLNDLGILETLHNKYDKFLPDVSFREPSPGVELKSGNTVSIWDCLKRDIWKRLLPSEDGISIGYLPVDSEEFLHSCFIKDTPSLRLIDWESYSKNAVATTGTGVFQIREIKFKANGTIQRQFDFDTFKVQRTSGFQKGQVLYFKPKVFFEEE